MITLRFQDGQVFVWKPKDWSKLQELRIVGSLSGSIAAFPRQWKISGLPLILSPEETSLLVEIGAARVVRHPSLTESPNDDLKQKYDAYLNSLKQEQVEYFRNERKRQVQDMIDSIVEGKKCKLLGHTAKKKKGKQATAGNASGSQSEESQSAVIDKDAVLKEELEKIDRKQLDSKDMVIPNFTSAPWLDEGEEIDWVEWICPRTRREKLLYMTFKSMWEKGYFITAGKKFGGDFLLYPGYPDLYHALFIVICMESDILDAKDIVAFGRLGNSVRKTIILASFSEDETSVVCQSLQWNSLLKQSVK